MDLQRVYPWVLRGGWLVLPFAAGPALGAALHPHSEAVRLAAAIVLWAGWATVLLGTLVPHPLGLTALRVGAPAAAAAVVAAVLTGRPSVLASVAALAVAAVDAAVAMAPPTGILYVNGPAYPNERRYPLRPPGPLLLGPLEVSWAIVVGAPTLGILLLAAGNWVAGAAVLLVGLPVAFVLARSLHGLSRRWVVFVPAGVVLHDPITLLDPVLFPRPLIEALRPAPAGSDSLDLTQGSLGLTLELLLTEKVPMARAKPGQVGGEQGASARLLFTPTRPGQVLSEAARRRVPVG
jgi:hypothetical protein